MPDTKTRKLTLEHGYYYEVELEEYGARLSLKNETGEIVGPTNLFVNPDTYAYDDVSMFQENGDLNIILQYNRSDETVGLDLAKVEYNWGLSYIEAPAEEANILEPQKELNDDGRLHSEVHDSGDTDSLPDPLDSGQV